MSVDAQLRTSLANIRRAAAETLRLAEANPTPRMRAALAECTEREHRVTCLGLRYPTDDRALLRELDRLP